MMTAQKRVVPALTTKSIEAAKPLASSTKTNADGSPKLMVARIRDGKETGLNLVVSGAGNKGFSFQYTVPGTKKRRYKKLGVYPDMSLADARAAAQDNQKLVRAGVDPIEQEETEKLEAETARQRAQIEALEKEASKKFGTVAAMFKLYAADLDRRGRQSKPMLKVYHKHIHARLGDLKAHEVTADDIADVISIARGTGYKRIHGVVREYMHAAWNVALKAAYSPTWKLTDEAKESDPYHDLKVAAVAFKKLTYNPVSKMDSKDGKSAPSNRVLSKDEIKQLWSGIGNGRMRADGLLALKMILATGQRVTEVLGARWEDFDLEEMEWSIPAETRKMHNTSGNNEPHIVAMCDLHLELLAEIRKYSGKSEFLFPNKSGLDHRTHNSLQQAVSYYCKNTGMEHWYPKVLRRTMKTQAGKAGVPKEIRDRIQGHSLNDLSSRHYDRYDYLPEKRAGMDKWCRALNAIVGGKSAEVVQLRKKHA